MRIIIYKTELNEEHFPILVKEKSHNYKDVKKLNNPELIAEMFNIVFRLSKQTEEYLYLLALNTNGRPLGVFEVSHGSVDATVSSPRRIFMKSLLCGARAIVLIHNHPSGDINPSKEDIEAYERLKKPENC